MYIENVGKINMYIWIGIMVIMNPFWSLIVIALTIMTCVVSLLVWFNRPTECLKTLESYCICSCPYCRWSTGAMDDCATGGTSRLSLWSRVPHTSGPAPGPPASWAIWKYAIHGNNNMYVDIYMFMQCSRQMSVYILYIILYILATFCYVHMPYVWIRNNTRQLPLYIGELHWKTALYLHIMYVYAIVVCYNPW